MCMLLEKSAGEILGFSARSRSGGPDLGSREGTWGIPGGIPGKFPGKIPDFRDPPLGPPPGALPGGSRDPPLGTPPGTPPRTPKRALFGGLPGPRGAPGAGKCPYLPPQKGPFLGPQEGGPGGGPGGPFWGPRACNPCPGFWPFWGAAGLLINVFFGQVLVCFFVCAAVWRGCVRACVAQVWDLVRDLVWGIQIWEDWRILLGS